MATLLRLRPLLLAGRGTLLDRSCLSSTKMRRITGIAMGWMVLSLPAMASEPSASQLRKYEGEFQQSPGQTLTIVLEGNQLRAHPSGAQPSSPLLPRKAKGLFSVRNHPFDIQFVEDTLGQVVGLEMSDMDGRIRRMTRLVDENSRQALRQIAVNADTSVNARVFNGYRRSRNAAGDYEPETFVFANGGFQDNSGGFDPSISRMKFEEIAHTLTPAFQAQGFVPSDDSENTDLLLMVYWGTTASDQHPAVIAQEEHDPLNHYFRQQLNRENATVLGFEVALAADEMNPLVRGSTRQSQLIEDLEESRYWIAILAMDFAVAREEKEYRPMWSIRYNIASRGTSFTRALPQMTQVASHFFGRSSAGLVNPHTQPPPGQVDFGEMVITEEDAELPESSP